MYAELVLSVGWVVNDCIPQAKGTFDFNLL
jgi:hypothetical protein